MGTKTPIHKRITRTLSQTTLRLTMGVALLATGCGQEPSSFSLLADEANFKQNAAVSNGKIDILWVIDNSGSMASSQQNVADNFQSFIELFNEKGYDYRIAVATSDAYLDLFGSPATQSQFRDGTDATGHTGVFVIDPNTPNLEQTFLTNIKQGTNGDGDERAFQSFRQTLNNPLNAGFPRPDAFLAVIIVSDEDDFSHDGPENRENQYSYAGLHTVQSYIDYLDQLTGATPENRSSKYNVNSIAILDQQCRDLLNQSSSGRKIGTRYMELTEATDGTLGDLCADFGPIMAKISNKIIELTTQFYLDREPVPATLVVSVNGQVVPRIYDDTPEPLHGYRYHEETNSLTFHGSYVPAAGASISVKFDPVSLK